MRRTIRISRVCFDTDGKCRAAVFHFLPRPHAVFVRAIATRFCCSMNLFKMNILGPSAAPVCTAEYIPDIYIKSSGSIVCFKHFFFRYTLFFIRSAFWRTSLRVSALSLYLYRRSIKADQSFAKQCSVQRCSVCKM